MAYRISQFAEIMVNILSVLNLQATKHYVCCTFPKQRRLTVLIWVFLLSNNNHHTRTVQMRNQNCQNGPKLDKDLPISPQITVPENCFLARRFQLSIHVGDVITILEQNMAKTVEKSHQNVNR